MGPASGMTQVFGYAMGSRFEMLLCGPDYELLASAGNRALEEIAAVEESLSHTIESSTLSWVNARAGQEPVRLDPPLYELLERARQLSQETEGAFDITVGALLHCWGFFRGQGRLPGEEEVSRALARTGWQHVHLDPQECTIRFDVDGLAIHMGALGKGYALDRAAEALREYGVAAALLHGGKSSIVAIGAPPGERGWRVGLPAPRREAYGGVGVWEYGSTGRPTDSPTHPHTHTPTPADARLGVIVLRDCALSVSGAQEQFFEVEGKRYGHILDPRTGWPAEAVHTAAVIAGSGEESEAFSTAFAVMGPDGARRSSARRGGIGAVIVPRSDEAVEPLVLRNPETGQGDGAPDWVWEESNHE